MQTEYREKLLERLRSEPKLSLHEAMDLLNVSESTARRIFDKMEKEGYAIRTHGGLSTQTHILTKYSFDMGMRTNIERKTAIARESVRLVEDGDVLFCDSGTTVQCFCMELARRIRTESLHIKLYTNSLANLEILSDVMEVVLVGGTYRPNRKDFCGYLANQSVSYLYFNKAFLGADGCVDMKAFSTTDAETARIDQIVVGNSDRAIILVDSTKFSSATHLIYMPFNNLYAIVTDDGIAPQQLKKLRDNHINVICAPLLSGTETGGNDGTVSAGN